MTKFSAPAWLTERPVAHRGLHAENTPCVENSMPAVEAAIEAGYAIEVDLQLAKDGQAVVFHDYTLERLTKCDGAIADFSLAKLKTIEIEGSNSNIASLADLFELVDGRVPLVLELKANRNTKDPKAIAKATAAELEGYDGPVAIMSFHPVSVKWFADNMPNVLRGMVLEASDKWYHFIPGWRRSRYCSHAKAQFVAHNVQDLPDRFTESWRRQGGKLLTWTVRSKADRIIAEKYADQMIFEERD